MHNKRDEQKFVKFLQDCGAYQLYRNALNSTHYGDIDYFFESTSDIPDNWISNVFIYDDTPQGSIYWIPLAKLWLDKLLEPEPVKIYKVKDFI